MDAVMQGKLVAPDPKDSFDNPEDNAPGHPSSPGSTDPIGVTSSDPEGAPSRLSFRFAPSSPAMLVTLLPHCGASYPLLTDAMTVIGRDSRRSDLVLFSSSVSQRHCQLQIEDDECSVSDLGSSNGTFINGTRLDASARIETGDLLTVGQFVFMFLWHRFIPPTPPDVIYYRDLQRALAELYPDPARIQTLLLASNLFHLPVDLSRGTSEQHWKSVIDELKKQDVLAYLDKLLTCARRSAMHSEKLKLAHEALQRWTRTKRGADLQQQTNIAVSNASRLVLQVRKRHAVEAEVAELPEIALEENSEEQKLFAAQRRLTPLRPVPVARTSPKPAELPFDPKMDESGSFPALHGSKKPTSGEGVTAASPATAPASAAPAGIAPSPAFPAAAASAGLAPSPVIPTAPAGTSEDGSHRMADAANRVPVANLSDLDEIVEITSGFAKDETVSLKPEDIPRPPWESARALSAPIRRRWGMIAASLAGLAIVLAFVFRSVSVESPEGRPSTELVAERPTTTGAAPMMAEESGKGPTAGDGPPIAASDMDRTRANPAPGAENATPPLLDAAKKSSAGSDLREGSQKTDPGGSMPTAARTAKPTASADAAKVSSSNIPVKLLHQTLNFLDDSGKGAYSKASVPSPALWDDTTAQVKKEGLRECQWIGSQQRTFPSKKGRTFYRILCKYETSTIAGWVNRAAIDASNPPTPEK